MSNWKKPSEEDIDKCKIILEGLDENNISSVLKTISNIYSIKKELYDIERILEQKIKTYMKERNWNTYNDVNTKISVQLDKEEEVIVDKDKIKLILTEGQYNSVITIKYKERIYIMDTSTKNRLKTFSKRGITGAN